MQVAKDARAALAWELEELVLIALAQEVHMEAREARVLLTRQTYNPSVII